MWRLLVISFAALLDQPTAVVHAFSRQEKLDHRPKRYPSHLAVLPVEGLDSGSIINLLSYSNAPSGAGKLVTTVLSNFDVEKNPVATAVGSYLLVTASDMVPFLPCQPLAIALGAKLGVTWAFPICTAGQTTAGILAFSAARRAAQSELVAAQGEYYAKLSPETIAKLEKFRTMTSSEQQDDRTILLALAGLRLAPFFPFSAGNYLLGGTTAVPISLFALATVLGCLLTNFASTSLGAGAMLLQAP